MIISFRGPLVLMEHVHLNSCEPLYWSLPALFVRREAYPSCQVCAVTLGYDVAKLMHLDKER